MIVTLWGAALIVLGIMGVLILLCTFVIRYQKNHPEKNYDERQIVYRGKAYGFGLIVCVIYYFVLSFYLMFVSSNLPEGDKISLLVLAGICVAWFAFELYCLMTGALLPLNDKMDEIFGLSCFMAVLALIGIVVHICFDGMSMGDDPTGVWGDLIKAAMFTSQAVIYKIAKQRDQRESYEQ